MKTKAALIAVAIALTACTKPTEAIIPSDMAQQKEFAEKVVAKLSEEEKQLYLGWLARRSLASAFSEAHAIPEGTTVANALADQREWLAKQEAAKAEELRLTQEREAAKAKALEELNAAIKITFAGKEVLPKNYRAGRYRDQQAYHISAQNMSDKAIKGVKGKLTFIDIFGKPIRSLDFELTENIQPSEKIDWTGTSDINEFIAEQVKISTLEADQYTTTIEPLMIVFSDGSRLSAP